MKPMTLAEMREWIASSKYVETQDYERDDDEIIWSMEVYEKDGQFYLVEREDRGGFVPTHGQRLIRDKSSERYLPVLAKKSSWMEYRCEFTAV